MKASLESRSIGIDSPAEIDLLLEQRVQLA
jgi:hypothetical protein